MVPIASKVGLCTQRYIKDINRSSNVREEFKHGTTSHYAVMAVVYFQNIVNLSLSRLSCQVKPVQPICFRFTLFYCFIDISFSLNINMIDVRFSSFNV